MSKVADRLLIGWVKITSPSPLFSTSSREGRTVLVTGAGSGMGRATTLRFGADGANVYALDIDASALADTSQQVKAEGGTIETATCDVSQRDQVFGLVEKAVAELGQLDIFVNNAGITRDTLMLRMSEDQWQSVMDINLKGTFFGCQAASKVMMMARKGCIVNIASVVALGGNAGQANYTASKAGVLALTRTIAIELGSRKVRVNAVAPGFFPAEQNRKLLTEERTATIMAHTPMARFGEADELAGAVVWLASDRASGFVTGAIIRVDGGFTAMTI